MRSQFMPPCHASTERISAHRPSMERPRASALVCMAGHCAVAAWRLSFLPQQANAAVCCACCAVLQECKVSGGLGFSKSKVYGGATYSLPLHEHDFTSWGEGQAKRGLASRGHGTGADEAAGLLRWHAPFA